MIVEIDKLTITKVDKPRGSKPKTEKLNGF